MGKQTPITIQLTKDEEEITLLIEDNGPGFDSSLLTQSTKGNGWKNIQSRANLIKGQVELDTELERQGTTFIVITMSQLQTSNELVLHEFRNQ